MAQLIIRDEAGLVVAESFVADDATPAQIAEVARCVLASHPQVVRAAAPDPSPTVRCTVCAGNRVVQQRALLQHLQEEHS